jgi:hypothetical protein
MLGLTVPPTLLAHADEVSLKSTKDPHFLGARIRGARAAAKPLMSGIVSISQTSTCAIHDPECAAANRFITTDPRLGVSFTFWVR